MVLLLLACKAPDEIWASTYAGSIHVEDTSLDSQETGETADTGPFPTTVIYLVRHAEKDSGSNPGLTEEGALRAQALAELMVDVPLSAVYATEYRRTQETVKPTADDHGLKVNTEIEPKAELPVYLVENHPDQTVLAGGHSFTIPSFLQNIGVPEGTDKLSGYGQLWIITVHGDDVTVVMDEFGD